MLEFRLLGPLEVRDGDRLVEVRRQKPRALLALLLLNAGRVVSKDRLVDQLWGDHAPGGAAHALENYVSQLRKLLGDGLLVTQPPGYVLKVEPDRIDALRFERMVAAARTVSAGERAGSLREALSLVRGAPLADLGDHPFAPPEIRRLEELELAAREQLIEAELELGRHADVVPVLEGLVAEHPYRERLGAQLMLALYRCGRQADALAVYQKARATLVEELGLDVGEELQELERAILRQEPSLRAPAFVPPVAAAAGPRAGRRQVSVVAAELVVSATDPELRQSVLDEFQQRARESAERHGGRVEQVFGDRVVLVFGVPAHEDDALRAVRAASELCGESVRIGVSTGGVLVAGSGELSGAPLSEAERLAGGAGEVVLDQATQSLVAAIDDRRGLRFDSPMVGRTRPLAALVDAFDGVVAERRCHLFTVLGAAGVGKSRLAGELSGRLGDGASVLHARCSAYGDTAFSPVAGAFGLDEGASAAELRSALEAAAQERPVVLVLDDLQWADPELLDLVEHVAEQSRDAPILIVCLARTELLDGRPTWGGGKVNASSILLEPVGDDESEQLIDNLLGASDLPRAVRNYLVRTAEGNPLFVEELLSSLVDQQVLLPGDSGWTTVEMPKLVIPASIQALLFSRVDRLPAELRAVLEEAAIEGREFRRETVAASDELLDALVRKDLIRRGRDGFAFRHQLLRDAVYEGIPKQARAELHERFAGRGGPDETVGYHLEQAVRLRLELRAADGHDRVLAAQAAELLGAAADRAEQRGDARAAARLRRREAALRDA